MGEEERGAKEGPSTSSGRTAETANPPSHEATADERCGEEACGPADLAGARIIPNKNRVLQVCETSRKKFDGARRRVFLEWFAGTGNLSLSARMADISYKTVLRHRMIDAGFRADFDEALEQSRVRLKAWAMEAKDDGRSEYDPEAHAPAHLDSAQVLQLLREEAVRERARDAAAVSGRRPSVASNDDVRTGLIRALIAHGLRVRGPSTSLRTGGGSGERGGGADESSQEAPAPASAFGCGGSPSPRNRGEDE
jgi:hypothetical protein